MGLSDCFNTNNAVNRICNLDWESFNEDQIASAAWMLYYLSIQFRKNLETAMELHPNDPALQELATEELHTDNLSPFPNIAEEGECLDHDEFLKRIIDSYPMEQEKKQFLTALGNKYLAELSHMPDEAKTMHLVSLEDGGASRIYQSILNAPTEQWESNEMQAFHHFLEKHVAFDNLEGEDAGHGALIRKLGMDDSIAPMYDVLADCMEEAIHFE
ncbi:MAG: hypothetical protein ACRBDL_04505 [Alphaproteobacteria bacterium]